MTQTQDDRMKMFCFVLLPKSLESTAGKQVSKIVLHMKPKLSRCEMGLNLRGNKVFATAKKGFEYFIVWGIFSVCPG